MVFPCLYCLFGGVATVSVGRYLLEIDVVFIVGPGGVGERILVEVVVPEDAGVG